MAALKVEIVRECLEQMRQASVVNQEISIDIRIGDFKFVFDSKQQKHPKSKSPSKEERDLKRQNQYANKFVKQEPQLQTCIAVSNIEEKEEKKCYVENAAQTENILLHDHESQTGTDVKNIETQTIYDDLLLVKRELRVDDKGVITAMDHELIVELKFNHDIETWEHIEDHIKNYLKLKMSSKPWLVSSGPHFKIVAFLMEKQEFEYWKAFTLDWDKIVRTARVSRIYR